MRPKTVYLLLAVPSALVPSSLIFERRRIGSSWWLPILGLLLFGVSVAMPLLLYLRNLTAASSLNAAIR